VDVKGTAGEGGVKGGKSWDGKRKWRRKGMVGKGGNGGKGSEREIKEGRY